MSTSILSEFSGLNSFDSGARLQALQQYTAGRQTPSRIQALNLHCHTYYSYNAHGLSPTGVACLLDSLGLSAGGIVDFDVLDGVEEFLGAMARLGMPACTGIETRVFIPERADAEINSPGEPGVAYHMGVGFVRSSARNGAFLERLKQGAQTRNLGILERVNAHLAPLTLDYAAEVLPLTPAGNPTERHLCAAYDAKARELFPEAETRAKYWAEKLGVPVENIAATENDTAAFRNLLRKVLMKRGGVGYVQPGPDSFPGLDEFNQFVAGEGAIPTVAWLDGCTAGEADPGALLDLHIRHGALALNIIPDRNWNLPLGDDRQRKVENLGAIVAAARERGLPVFVGTEMNAPGQPDVDNFVAEELRPFVEEFEQGAMVAAGHTLLASQANLGYVSPWALENLPDRSARRDFYTEVGKAMWSNETLWSNETMWSNHAAVETVKISEEMTPDRVLREVVNICC